MINFSVTRKNCFTDFRNWFLVNRSFSHTVSTKMNCGLKCDMHEYSPIQRCSRKGHSIHLLVFGHKLLVRSSRLVSMWSTDAGRHMKNLWSFSASIFRTLWISRISGHNKFSLSRLSHGRSMIQIQKIPIGCWLSSVVAGFPLLQPSTRQFEKAQRCDSWEIFSTRTPSAYRRFGSYPWSVFRTIKFCSSRSQ